MTFALPSWDVVIVRKVYSVVVDDRFRMLGDLLPVSQWNAIGGPMREVSSGTNNLVEEVQQFATNFSISPKKDRIPSQKKKKNLICSLVPLPVISFQYRDQKSLITEALLAFKKNNINYRVIILQRLGK